MYLEDGALFRKKQEICRKIGNIFRQVREDCGLSPEQTAALCRYMFIKSGG